MVFDNITAVVPVREKKKGDRDNSLLKFGDVTLLEWKLLQLKRVLPQGRIFLSTNSDEAAELAKPYLVNIVEREDKNCADGVPFPTVLHDIISKVNAKDIAICPCTAPMLGPRILSDAFGKYNENLKKKAHFSLTAVNEMREYLWDGQKPINYRCDSSFPAANKLPTWYRVTNGLFMMGKERMLETGYFLDSNPCLFVIDNFAGTDIVHFKDYELTRELLSYYLNNEAVKGKRD